MKRIYFNAEFLPTAIVVRKSSENIKGRNFFSNKLRECSISGIH